jgi:pre-mRNA-processing factor 39
MADLAGLDDDFVELRKFNQEVVRSFEANSIIARLINKFQHANADDFEAWEKLVRAAENLEGGLTRNSSPQAITAFREIFDKFLAKFPLFFGYWKKYADLEFSIAGTEAAEMVRSTTSDVKFCVDSPRSMNAVLLA